jgi:hypothetical protein
LKRIAVWAANNVGQDDHQQEMKFGPRTNGESSAGVVDKTLPSMEQKHCILMTGKGQYQ